MGFTTLTPLTKAGRKRDCIDPKILYQVQAFRSDGRLQRVIYTFVKGNELGGFEINSNNGLIRVRDSQVVDYEQHTEFVLTVSGRGLGASQVRNFF